MLRQDQSVDVAFLAGIPGPEGPVGSLPAEAHTWQQILET